MMDEEQPAVISAVPFFSLLTPHSSLLTSPKREENIPLRLGAAAVRDQPVTFWGKLYLC